MGVGHVDGRGGGWVDLCHGQRPPVGRVVVPARLLGLVARTLLLLGGRPVLHVDLALLHVPLVLLPLVALLVLEGHLLEALLGLGVAGGPAPAHLLGNITHPQPGMLLAHRSALRVGEPHETRHVPFRCVGVLLGPPPPPLSRQWGHLVLLLLLHKPFFVHRRDGVEFVPDLLRSLRPLRREHRQRGAGRG